MGGLAWWHWLIIIAAFILLFGARKLPEAARGLGRSLRILKSEVNAMHEDDEMKANKPTETDMTAQQPTAPAQITAVPLAQQQPAVQVPVQQPVAPVQVPVPQAAAPVQQQQAAQPAYYAAQSPTLAAEPVPVPQTDYYSDPTRPAVG